MAERRNPRLFGQPMVTSVPGSYWVRHYGDVCACIQLISNGQWIYSFGTPDRNATTKAEAERKLESLIRKTWRSMYAVFRRASRG